MDLGENDSISSCKVVQLLYGRLEQINTARGQESSIVTLELVCLIRNKWSIIKVTLLANLNTHLNGSDSLTVTKRAPSQDE